MKSLNDRQTMNALADRLVEACEVIDRKDETIDDLRGRLARSEQERDGCHEANVALFMEKSALLREVTVLRAELAEERGRS